MKKYDSQILNITFPIILILLGVALVVLGYDYQAKARSSATWPKTQGLVLTVDYERTSAGRRTGLNSPLVTYRYDVNGSTFISDMRSFRDDGKSSKDIFKEYTPNQKVSVFYNPIKPSQATLVKGANSHPDFGLIYGLVILISGLVTLAINGIGIIKKRKRVSNQRVHSIAGSARSE
ncbi:MAG: DUF3592 domain-containing protein [Kiritimatiellales bacterium]|nr:DUF3592 domain-containing protein [Kiritimatiellales bacterium]